MPQSLLNELVIRTAIVVRSDLGYIYACDQKKEEEWIPHTVTFRWMAGVLEQGECNYNAHTACVIKKPEPGLVDASEAGYYSIISRGGVKSDDIFNNSQPPTNKQRRSGIGSVSSIGGEAYAVGLSGIVYRLETFAHWSCIDNGLPETFDIHSIHGFNASDIYAVGSHGENWHYNGKIWTNIDLPTNRHLTTIKCADDGMVYIAGHDGVLIRGRDKIWECIEHDDTIDDIWDLEWFEGRIYISTFDNVYRLNNNRLEIVNFGDDPPNSSYQLSVADGVMWSIGEFDIMSFDGKVWTRII